MIKKKKIILKIKKLKMNQMKIKKIKKNKMNLHKIIYKIKI